MTKTNFEKQLADTDKRALENVRKYLKNLGIRNLYIFFFIKKSNKNFRILFVLFTSQLKPKKSTDIYRIEGILKIEEKKGKKTSEAKLAIFKLALREGDEGILLLETAKKELKKENIAHIFDF